MKNVYGCFHIITAQDKATHGPRKLGDEIWIGTETETDFAWLPCMFEGEENTPFSDVADDIYRRRVVAHDDPVWELVPLTDFVGEGHEFTLDGVTWNKMFVDCRSTVGTIVEAEGLGSIIGIRRLKTQP